MGAVWPLDLLRLDWRSEPCAELSFQFGQVASCTDAERQQRHGRAMGQRGLSGGECVHCFTLSQRRTH